MVDVPPSQRLEPASQDWARWTTKNIQQNSTDIASLRTNAKSQNETAAAQFNRLQLQVADLQGRVAHVQQGVLNTNIALGPNILSGAVVPNINFTLNEQRRVVASFTTSYEVIKTSAGSVDGSLPTFINLGGIQNFANYGLHSSGAQDTRSGAITVSAAAVIPAGDHTSTAGVNIYFAPTSASGSIRLLGSYLFTVQVLEIVE